MVHADCTRPSAMASFPSSMRFFTTFPLIIPKDRARLSRTTYRASRPQLPSGVSHGCLIGTKKPRASEATTAGPALSCLEACVYCIGCTCRLHRKRWDNSCSICGPKRLTDSMGRIKGERFEGQRFELPKRGKLLYNWYLAG